ncbi:helix-turn-helix transcriptional regulator [Novosphingobium mathurense]|uniref:DNA-binding transcriptional regulator, XRE-family HTH domain n=1 Tax=Novosphingobium mathurense TaxID=428990 RepID=A0A1U6INT5_9SPHN|nr:helix-turn-helix transcriptional regulator [Novosphingobium mathurense]SLK09711.1 DNA-binding transcriptional regulator, XRE-family HTH domain [Novosphingobium mathurense]
MGEMITIPLDEYRAMKAAVIDLADLHSYDRAMAAIARGEEELVPAEVAQRLFDGEAPLRVWREYRGLTQQALANASGVNRVQIANIEAGDRVGSVATLGKLADALGILIDDLA